jgi:hypothetical protein
LALHYLLPTAVAFAFAVTAALEIWELRAYVVTLLAWTAAGSIDLALLLKVLPDRRAGQVHSWRRTP